VSQASASLSFDQAADYYDQTRRLPEPLATGGIQMILDRCQARAGRAAQLLEVGTGTGRIAIPLLERGANLFGCDLSSKMLARQRAKRPAARLAQADATALPYGDAQFDAVLTIHLLHLVGDWRTALREIRRVLRPGGLYVNSWNPHTNADIDTRLRDYWRDRVEAHGAQWRRPGVQTREELLGALGLMGATVEELTAGRSVHSVSPQAVIASIASRIYSDTWEVPDDVFSVTLGEVREWAAHTYGDLNQAETVEQRFVLDVARFIAPT
jgi:ubiquinone/menaquinone biosynthesis C-methylase UbiE